MPFNHLSVSIMPESLSFMKTSFEVNFSFSPKDQERKLISSPWMQNKIYKACKSQIIKYEENFNDEKSGIN